MSAQEDAASDYIAEFAYGLGKDWQVDMRYLWDAEIDAASRSEVAVVYSKDPRRSVRLAYRSRWARTENLDLAFRWAVNERWTAVGRYNYSFAERRGTGALPGIRVRILLHRRGPALATACRA